MKQYINYGLIFIGRELKVFNIIDFVLLWDAILIFNHIRKCVYFG